MSELIMLGEELQKQRVQLQTLLAEGGSDLKLNDNQIETIRAKKAEVDDLGKKYQTLREVTDLAEKNARDMAAYEQPVRNFTHATGEVEDKKSGGVYVPLHKRVTDSNEYKNRAMYGGRFVLNLPDVDVKTLMERTAGFAPENMRLDRVVLSAQVVPNVASLIPQSNTSLNDVKFMYESTFTNNAAFVAEGSAVTDSALVFTEQSDPVEKIVGWLPVTDEQLDDVEGMQSLIGRRLMDQVAIKEEAGLLTGNGTPPQLTGINSFANIQTQALGTDTKPDAVFKAMTLVRFTGRAEPSGVIMHPNDWQDYQLLTTADGVYIWGSPADANLSPRIWGLPVVLSTQQTENTAIVGDFARYSEIFRRKGVVIEVSDSHSTYFTEGKKAIKATARLALVCYRGTAFCKVTGL
jgi:HK97 family phage major capsid protein